MNKAYGPTLFEERARREHPVTSHIRAQKLNNSLKLSKQIFAVLETIERCEGLTARGLGLIMVNQSGKVDRLDWPHKCMARLVRSEYVERKSNSNGLLCYITQAGRDQLKIQRTNPK